MRYQHAVIHNHAQTVKFHVHRLIFGICQHCVVGIGEEETCNIHSVVEGLVNLYPGVILKFCGSFFQTSCKQQNLIGIDNFCCRRVVEFVGCRGRFCFICTVVVHNFCRAVFPIVGGGNVVEGNFLMRFAQIETVYYRFGRKGTLRRFTQKHNFRVGGGFQRRQSFMFRKGIFLAVGGNGHCLQRCGNFVVGSKRRERFRLVLHVQRLLRRVGALRFVRTQLNFCNVGAGNVFGNKFVHSFGIYLVGADERFLHKRFVVEHGGGFKIRFGDVECVLFVAPPGNGFRLLCLVASCKNQRQRQHKQQYQCCFFHISKLRF